MGYNCPTTVYTSISTHSGANYSVTFRETGLQANTDWTVTLNGQTESSNGKTITFEEEAGTYSYSIGLVGGYSSNIKSGTVIVGGEIGSQVLKAFYHASQAGTSGIAYDPKNGYVYVADSGSDNITVISGEQIISTVHVPSFMFQGYPTYPFLNMIACDSSRGLVYVTAYNSTMVYVINGTNLYGTVSLASTSNASAISTGSTYGVAYDSTYGIVYVARPFGNLVSVISGLRVIVNLSVSSPEQIAVNSMGYAYVTSGNTPKLFLINDTYLMRNITVFPGFSSSLGAIAYDSLNGFIYAASTSQQVAYLNFTSVVGVLNTSSDPSSIAFNPSSNLLYMTTDYPQGSVLVSNGTQVLSTIHDSPGTSGLAYNAGNGFMYVTNRASGNVSILAPGNASVVYVLFQPAPSVVSTVTSSIGNNSSATNLTPSISDYTIAAVAVVVVVSIAIASSYFLRRKP